MSQVIDAFEDDTPEQTIAVDAFEDHANPEIVQSYEAARGVNPDQYAEAMKLAKDTGLSPDVVHRNMDQVREMTTYNPAFVDQFDEVEEAAEWAKNPDNLKITYDLPNYFTDMKKTMRGTWEGVKSSKAQLDLTAIGKKELYGQPVTPEEEELAASLYTEATKQLEHGGAIGELVTEAARSSLPGVAVMGKGAIGGGLGAAAGTGTALALNMIPGLAVLPEELITIPSLAGKGAKIGYKIGATKENFEQQATMIYYDMMQTKDLDGKPMDKDIARGAAIAAGIPSALLDQMAFDQILSKVPVPYMGKITKLLNRGGIKGAMKVPGMAEAFKRIGKDWVKNSATEGVTEAAQQSIQIFAEEVAKAYNDGRYEDFDWSSALSEVGQAGYIGAGVGGIYSTPVAVAQGTHAYRNRDVRTPEQTAAYAQNLNQKVRGDVLYQRNQDAFHELVSAIGKDEKLYVAPEPTVEVIQSLSPEQQEALFTAVPSLQAEIERAATSGSDISISKADYMTYIAPFEQSDALVNHIKLDPADQSLFERQAMEEAIKAAPDMAAQIQAEVGQAKPVSAEEMYPTIQRVVSRAMQGVGRNRQESDAVGALFARTISRFSAPFGQNGVDYIMSNVMQFQALDENGTPALRRSNVDVILDDLDATNAGRAPRGIDEQYRTALASFKTRLDDAGLTPDLARKMPYDELMDRLYPTTDSKKEKDSFTSMLEQQRQADRATDIEPEAAPVAQAVIQGAGKLFQLGNAQRNKMGLYSAVEREVLNMNIPQWKPSSKPLLTDEQRAELATLMKEVTSTADERYPRRLELAALARKEQGLAKGADIWQKVEKLPVKKEEMEWLGLHEYLTADPSETFTREDVVNFIRDNGIQIEEVVADQEASEVEMDFRGEAEPYERGNGDADYYRDEIRPDGSYDYEYDDIVEKMMDDEQHYIDENYEGDRDDAEAVKSWFIEQFASEIESKVDDRAEEMAEDAYNDNPYMRYTDRTTDYEIFGNDDIGYHIVDANGGRHDGNGRGIYSLSEAEIQARDIAVERGDLQSEDSPNVAKWEDYVSGQYSNYREKKLVLPTGREPDDFYYNSHFDDANIVAFLRETDRVLPSVVPDGYDVNAEVENIVSPEFDDETGGFGSKAEQAAFEESRQAVLESYKYAGVEPDVKRMEDYTSWENIVIGNFALAERVADEAYELARANRNIVPNGEYAVSVAADAFDKIYRERRRLEINAGQYRKFQQEKRYAQDKIDEENSREGKIQRSQYANKNAYFIDEFQSDWHQQGRKHGYKTGKEDAGELEEQSKILRDKSVERHAVLLAEKPALAKKFDDFIEAGIKRTNDEAARLVAGGMNDISVNSNRDGIISNIEAYRTNHVRLIEQFLKGEHKAQDDGAFTLHYNREFEAFQDADVKTFLKEYQAEGGKEVINYMKASDNAMNQAEAERYGVPDVPFKDDGWLALGLKRALVDAVEKGYKRIGWADAEVVIDRWSERYEKLYRMQYDTKMPSIIKRITGIEPIHVEDSDVMGRNNDGGYWYIDITPELEAKIKNEGFTLFQRANGWINFEEGLNKLTIAFTSGANLSTAAHEMSHFGVAMHRQAAALARMAQAQAERDGNEVAPEIKRIIDDWDTLKKSVGATDDVFSVAQEEKAARLFEAYLREGNAPSESLRRIFARFRDWMTKIYADVKNLLGEDELNDEMRGVFDRWLASEREIEEVRGKNDALAQMAQNLGLDATIIEKVANYVNSATIEAEDKLYKELDREQKKRETDAYKRELKDMKETVGEEYLQRREYAVMKYMEDMKFKFLDGYGMDGIPDDMLAQDDGEGVILPDDIAEMFGYGSGDELIRAIKRVPDFDIAVDREARRRLLDKFPDMIQSGRIQNFAVEAIQNDKVLLALDLMIKELGKAAGVTPVNMKQFAKVIAQRQVLDMKQADSNYAFRYDVARDKAMREGLRASRAGDPRKAMIELQKAMVNQMVFKQLNEFNEFKDKAQQLFAKVNGKDKKLAGGRDIDFIGAARYILSKFGLGQVDPSFDVTAWMQDLNERNPDIAQDIMGLTNLVQTQPKVADDLTIAEYKDIFNAIENIYQAARTSKEIMIAGRKMRIEQAVQEATAGIDVDSIPLRQSTQVLGREKFKQNISTAKAALRRVENWTVAMDGKKDGAMWRYVWKPINDAVDTYKHERNRWMKRLRATLKKHDKRLSERRKIATGMMKKDDLGRVTELVFDDRMQMIGFLLHTGNESNLDKLLGGYGIDRSAWEAAKDDLSRRGIIQKEDLELVREMWAMAEDLKPISQKAHKNLFGYRFEEIEPQPISFPLQDGTVETLGGGYWPAIVDTDQTTEGKTTEQLLEQSRQYIIATTGRGFTYGRVQGYKQPLKTDIRLASQHIDKVLRFSYLEPAIRDVNRIVNNRDFKNRVTAVDASAVNDMLQPWLSRVATQATSPMAVDRSASMGGKMVNFATRNASLQIMGYNIVVAVQNFANIPASAHQAGWRRTGSAFARFVASPLKMRRDVMSASKMMADRMTNNDEKAAQEIEQIADRSGRLKKGMDVVVRNSRIFMLAIDNIITPAIWTAGYNKALEQGMNHDDAVGYADQIIRETQGASNAKDISRLEASSPVVKGLMPFYSFFGAQANLISTEFGNIMRQQGWRGSPKMFMTYLSLIAAPAIVGQIIADALRGRLPDDEDEDGQVIDDWLAYMTKSQVFYLTAMIPFFGQSVNAVINHFDDNPMNDRLSISPAVSMIEGAARLTKNTARALSGDDVNDGRMIADAAQTVGFFSGIPLGQPSRPFAYLSAAAEGNAEAENAYDVMTGLLTGRTSER